MKANYINMENRIKELIIKEIERSITTDEFLELEQWLANSPDNQQLFVDLLALYKKSIAINYLEQDKTVIISERKAQLLKRMNPRKRVLWSSSVAAIFVVGIISSAFLLLNRTERIQNTKPTSNDTTERIVLRPSDKGIVLVESGKDLHIDNDITKYLHKDILVTKSSLDYSKASTQTTNVISTLFIPKGKRFQLTLSDGTKLWINSNTEVEYPSYFDGDTRRIKVKGEVFLEVVHNPLKPFIVEAYNAEIKVLGTKFNVKAYPESSDVITTLLKGSVIVNNESVLSTNEQLSFNKLTSKTTLCSVDGDSAAEWIKGIYRFDNMKLENLVKLFNLVYGVEIEIGSKKSLETIFTGSIHDTIPYEEMFQIIIKTANVECTIDKDKIKIW